MNSKSHLTQKRSEVIFVAPQFGHMRNLDSILAPHDEHLPEWSSFIAPHFGHCSFLSVLPRWILISTPQEMQKVPSSSFLYPQFGHFIHNLLGFYRVIE